MLPTVRSLLNRPAYSLTIVVTLALGLGLATAILSLLSEIYFKPLPQPDAERLGVLYHTYPERGWTRASCSVVEIWDVAQRNSLFESTSVFAAFRNLNLTGDGPAEELQTNFSEAAHLQAQGAQPLLGRLFTPEETRRNSGARVVILAHHFWQARFGGRSDILGRTLHLNGQPFTVIGVMPRNYRDVGARWQRTDIFAPLAVAPLAYNAGMFEQRGAREYYGLIKLKPGVTAAQAQRELDAIAAQLAREFPEAHEGRGFLFMPLREYFYGDVSRLALVLGAGAAFVLLITCVNLGHLLLVQGERRRGEMAVRAALGADRGTLVRALLGEIALLTVVGGALGIGLAALLVEIFNREGVLQIPTFTVVALNPAAIAGALLLMFLCALASGLLPALRVSRVDLREALQSGALRATGGRNAALRRNGLIALEVALAAVLLVGATLTALSLRRLEQTSPGYDPSRLLSATFELDRVRYADRPALARALQRLQEDLANLPGVRGATFWGPRVLGRATYNVFTTPGTLDPAERNNQFMTRRVHVMPDAFATVGISLRAGATFSPNLVPGQAPYEVVIGENYARRFWPKKSPAEVIGETVYIHSGGQLPARVVGVAADVRHSGRTYDESQLIGDVYLSQQQFPALSQSLLIRHEGDPAAVLAAAKAAMARFDPEIALADIATMQTRLEQEAGVQELTASLFGVYATLATLLAALGVYGVLAFAVAQRTREFGVRLAVGARPAQILGALLRQNLLWIPLGVAVGLFSAWHLSFHVQALLVPGMPAEDAHVFGAVAAGLFAIGTVACWFPAWRASRTDPLVALRSE